MSEERIAIRIEHVGKTFQPQSSSKTIKEGFIGLSRKLTGKKKLSHHQGEYTALKDISFEVKKGEFFGIVGRNGCGKSTLLKILAGVYTPTKGHVQVNGKLTPFIELGVGFNPELSGRDNVFLNGALLGFTRKQMEEMYDDIVEFAELHDFMETKLKNYSSGMQVRLAFSVAIRAESDVLLIDEVLAVGDAAFQQKCYEYFELLKSNKKTVVFVTHDMGAFRQYCDKGVYLSKGEISLIANPPEIAAYYDKENYSAVEQSNRTTGISSSNVTVKIINDNNKESTKLIANSNIKICVSWHNIEEKVGIVGVMITREGLPIFATNSIGQINHFEKNESEIEILQCLGDGRYSVTIGLFGKTRHDTILMKADVIGFTVYGNSTTGTHQDEWTGVSYLENKWLK